MLGSCGWRSFKLYVPLSTAARHERRRQATLWVLRGAFLVRELQDSFLGIVYRGRTIHRGHLLLGTVSGPPYGTYRCCLSSPCGSPSILTLAISRRWNPLPILRKTRLRVSIWRTMLYWVVTLQRVCVCPRTSPTTFHSYHDAQALYVSGNVTESMDLNSDRTSEGSTLRSLLMFLTAHISGYWAVHHRTYREPGNCG